MKINIFRFSDADTIDINIKTGVTGTEQVTNLADKMLKLDKSVENAKAQLNAFKTLLQNLSTHSTTTMKNDLTKIKAAFDSVAAMKILPADVRKSMQQLSTIFNIADKPKQLDKTVKSVNSLLDIYDKYEKVRGYSTTDEDEDKGDYTTNRHQSIISTVGPVKELTLGYKSLIQQEQSNIDVMTKLYSAYNNIGSATKTAKTHIVTFDDAVKINVKTLEEEQKALEKYLTVSKSSSFLKTGGDTGVTSLLATTGSLQSTNNQFNNLQTYSFGVVNALTDATKGLYNVGDAALTNQPKVAAFGDMIESATQKLKANTDELTKNQTATNNYQSALSLTSTFGGGGEIAKMAASGFDKSTVSLIQEVNGALKETGAVMLNTAGQSQTLTNKVTENKNVFTKLLGLLKKIPKNLSEVEKGFRSLSLVRLTYLWNAVKRVSSVFVQAVENTANYEESLNLFKMSIGQKYLQDAEAWSAELTDKLMIDPAELMQYTGTFNNLAEGLGVQADDAYEMSKALTQLTYDMSSYLNIDPSAAATKLQSAMSGQARAIQGVGVAIQSASLEELAESLGIEKSVSEMTQAEKTYLRYIQIMKTTKHMQGDLGATMITPANAIRILKTQISLLSRAIGEVLTPIIMRVLPWIMALTNWLTEAASKLGKLLGYKVKKVDMGDAFYNASDAVEDYGDSAEEAGKKVKNSLAPFDELNVVMSSSGSEGQSDDSILGILQKELEGYDMLERYTDDLKKRAKELEGSLTPLFTAIGVFVVGKSVLDLATQFSKLKKSFGDAKGDAEGLWKYINSLAVIASAAVIIGCIVKISGDIEDMRMMYDMWVNPTKSEESKNSFQSSYDKTKQEIEEGNTLAAKDGYNRWVDDMYSQEIRSKYGLNELTGAKGFWNDVFLGKHEESTAAFNSIIDTYDIVNDHARTLLNTHELDAATVGDMKTRLEKQLTSLEKMKKKVSKNSATYKNIQESINDTKSVIDMINKDGLDKSNEKTGHLKKNIEESFEKFKGTATETNSISDNISRANETMSTSVLYLDDVNSKTSLWSKLIDGVKNLFNLTNTEASTVNDTLEISNTKTGLFSKAIGFVKGLFPGLKSEVDTVNTSLSTSNTKTGTWKDNLASVEDTIVGKITKPFNNFLSKLTTKKTLTVDTSTADKTVNDLVTKSNKLNSTKTLKIKADTVNANSVIQKLFGGESLLGKLTKKLGFDVDFFADGGYPTSGELFFANENGRAEFITSVGGKTAVANQDQMVQALTNAIMAGFAMTAPNNNTKQPINVNIGNERVYSGMIEYQNRQSDRYGTTTTINI